LKISHGTLVLVADGRKMLVFRNEGDEAYPVLQTMRHEEIANPPTRELGTDRPGRSFSSTGRSRSSYSETDWHRQEEERFATRAVKLLEEVARDSDVGLVMIAPPQVLGALRKQLGASFKHRLRAEINKDLVDHDVSDIAEAIARHSAQVAAP
jgi:protein required for attachment to host cells